VLIAQKEILYLSNAQALKDSVIIQVSGAVPELCHMPFASRLAPTGQWAPTKSVNTPNHCGSGLAREEAHPNDIHASETPHKQKRPDQSRGVFMYR
jgi:hypothetical protein